MMFQGSIGAWMQPHQPQRPDDAHDRGDERDDHPLQRAEGAVVQVADHCQRQHEKQGDAARVDRAASAAPSARRRRRSPARARARARRSPPACRRGTCEPPAFSKSAKSTSTDVARPSSLTNRLVRKLLAFTRVAKGGHLGVGPGDLLGERRDLQRVGRAAGRPSRAATSATGRCPA